MKLVPRHRVRATWKECTERVQRSRVGKFEAPLIAAPHRTTRLRNVGTTADGGGGRNIKLPIRMGGWVLEQQTFDDSREPSATALHTVAPRLEAAH